MPKLTVTCPSCKARWDASEATRGGRMPCPRCGARIPVPLDPGNLLFKTIGGCRILRKLGEGSFGIVYLAQQISLRRKVAFKVLKTSAFAADFVREAMAAARINHPNIVSVFDVAEAEGLTFIIMEYVKGVSLRRLLRRTRKLPIPRAIAIARQIMSALARAHRDRLIHRDVKPGNIMVDLDGTAKVTDFGLARFFEPIDEDDSSEGPGQTGAGRLRSGTPGYASPEQTLGRRCGVRTDIYSAGVTIFRMLAGKPPFQARSKKELRAKSVSEPAPALSAIDPEIPPRLSALVQRMMGKAPRDRPANANEVLEELDEIERELNLSEAPTFAAEDWRRDYVEAKGEPEPGTETGVEELAQAAAPSRAPMWPVIIAMGAAMLALIVAGYVFWSMGSRTPTPVETLPAAQSETSSTTVTTTTLTATTVGNPVEERAQGLYRAAQEYARAYPQDYASIISKFEDVARTAPGTEYALLARRDVAEAKGKWLRLGRPVVDGIAETANRLAAADRFQDALDACQLPKALEGSGLEANLEVLRADIQAQGRKRVTHLASQFRTRLQADEFAAAQNVLDTLTQLRLPESVRVVTTLGRDLAARRREVETEWALEAKVSYFDVLQQASQLVSRRDYDAALGLIHNRIGDPHHAAVRVDLEKERAGLRAAKDVFERALAYLRDHPGIEVRVKGIAGRFREIRDGLVMMDSGGGQFGESVTDLSGKEIARLAKAVFADQAAAEAALFVGAFLLYDQRFREAEKEFEAAVAAGGDAEYYVWRLQIAADDRWEEAKKPAVGERALHRMRQARQRGEWEEVLKQVFELRQLIKVPIVWEHRKEFNAAYNEAIPHLKKRK